MLRIVGGMGIMACPTGSAFYLFIDMHVMKILVSVAETGQRGGEFLFGDGLLMAHKTELVVTRLVWGIEKFRKIFTQQSEIIRAMGIMTTRAVFLAYGAVMIPVILQHRLHIGYPRLALITICPVMTTQAEVRWLHEQLVGIISDMGVVAGKTPLLGIESAMGHLSRLDIPLFVVMTGEAEIFSAISAQIILKRSAVGAVTQDAPFRHRRVHMFFPFNGLPLLLVARETDLVALGQKELRVIALMGLMANSAPTHRHRAVDKFP